MASRPPVQQNPGTIADGDERLPEYRPPRITMTPPVAPQSWGEWATEGFDFDTFRAGRQMMRTDRTDFEELMLRDGYAPIVNALELDLGQNPSLFSDTLVRGEPILRQSNLLPRRGPLSQMANRSTQERLIAEAIRNRRLKDPKFLPGVPDTVAGLRAWFLDAEKKKRSAARGTLEAAPSGLGTILSEFGGGVVEAFHDPLNIVSLPIGGGGKTFVQVAARETLINGALELVQQPTVARNREIIGEELTLGEAAANVGIAGIGGGTLETGLYGVGKAVKPLAGAALERVREAAARLELRGMKLPPVTDQDFFEALDNRQLTAMHRELAGDSLTPDEQAAIDVLERGADVADTSPYEPGAAGSAAHESNLAEAIEALARENRQAAAPEPAPAAGDRPTAAPERPPGATSTAARRPQTGEPAIAAFKAKARGAESGGDDRAANPRSTARGRYQFTDATWAEYHRRIYGGDGLADKFNPEKQERLMDALTRDNADRLEKNGFEVTEGNLYLMHFLGAGGGPKVLRSGPDTPIEQLLSDAVLDANPFLKGKTAADVVDWAHGKMGGQGQAPRGMAGGFETDPSIARLRAEAADLDSAVIGFTPLPGGGQVPLYGRRIPASEALVDAARFQFKSGGDGEGVIDTLIGVEQWDTMSSGRLTFWQDLEGRYWVADGHQRSGLARRIQAKTGETIMLDGIVMREADGVTAEMARSLAALVNIRSGSTSLIDAAKALRGLGFDTDLNLPPKSAFVRDAQGLTRLSDDAFGVVFNGRVAPEIAATVGRLLPDQPELHAGMVDILMRTDPRTIGLAESIVRLAAAAGRHSEEQIDLFGTEIVTRSLFLERAKVLEKALGEMRKMRVVHSTAAKNAGELEAKGSRIARAASEKEAKANAETAEIVARLYTRAGPVSDALGAAAGKLAAGGKLGDAADEFVAAIKQLDLDAIARGSDGADPDVDLADGAGRFGDAAEAGEAIPDEQPSLLELERATELFSDPDGPGVKAQADSLVHDLRAEAAGQLPNAGDRAPEQNLPSQSDVDRLIADAEDLGVELTLTYPRGAQHITLDQITRTTGEKGAGAEAMEYLTEFADNHGLKIELAASTADLVPYYERFGFRALEPFEAGDLEVAMGRDPGTEAKAADIDPEMSSDEMFAAIRDLPDTPESEDAIAAMRARLWEATAGDTAAEQAKLADTIDRFDVARERWDEQFAALREAQSAAARAEQLEIQGDQVAAVQEHLRKGGTVTSTTHTTQLTLTAPEHIRDRPNGMAEIMERGKWVAVPSEGLARLAGQAGWKPRETAIDLTHYDALQRRLADERRMLGEAKTDKERELRQVWIDQLGREIAAELKFLGIEKAPDVDLSDEELLAELAGEAALDLGEAVDPSIAERQRQELALRAGSPLRPGDVDAKGELGLALFDQADQPGFGFRLEEEGEAIEPAKLIDELDADEAAATALRNCL